MPTIVRSRVKDFAQETNKILSEMPYEKRRSIRKLIETLRPNEPIEEYLISDPGAFTWEKPSFGSRIDVWACGGGSGEVRVEKVRRGLIGQRGLHHHPPTLGYSVAFLFHLFQVLFRERLGLGVTVALLKQLTAQTAIRAQLGQILRLILVAVMRRQLRR